MANKHRYKVEEIEAALKAKAGLVTAASEALGCDRTTVIRYINKHPRLQKVQEDIRERMKDLAEGALYKLLSKEHAPTVHWYLGRMAADRGYGQTIAMEGTRDGPPIQVEGKATVKLYLPDNGRDPDINKPRRS